MYKLILKKGYEEMHFAFNDEDRLKDFMFEALDSYVKCDSDDESEKEFTVNVKKCAEGGNPETAHIKKQFDDTED